MRAGIAAEADAILFGERQPSEDEIVARLRTLLKRCFAPERGKKRVLIIKSEGVKIPTHRLVARLAAHLAEDAPGVDIRETILGHLVRGGHPSALDRHIAQRLGYAAVLAAEAGASDLMLAWDAPGAPGSPTADASIRVVPIAEVLAETERLLDGTSPVVRRRIALLSQVEDLLSA
jgi:6-phosphofructokinase 1